MEEGDVIALDIAHGSAHSREAFAKSKIVGGVVFGRFARGPIPVTAVLDIHDEELVIADGLPAGLESQIIHATEALLEHLGRHYGRAYGQNDAAVELLDRPADPLEIGIGGGSYHHPGEHSMIRGDVIT